MIIKSDGKYYKTDRSITTILTKSCPDCQFYGMAACDLINEKHDCLVNETFRKLSARERFFLFLKQEQVFWRWRYEVIKAQNKGVGHKKISNPSSYIGSAFAWQGQSLWIEAHEKWLAVLESEGYLK